MADTHLPDLYNIEGKVAAVTGGGGVLCGTMGRALAGIGVKVALMDIQLAAAQEVIADIEAAGGDGIAVTCNVLDKESLAEAAGKVLDAFSRVDILINGAGGNKPQATTAPGQCFFDLPVDAVQWVFSLNFLGTFLSSQVFGRLMADRRQGTILNISSMNAFRPLTKIPAYSAAKASVSNFTKWLAVHMAQEYSPDIRVNAIAPGFFLTNQNRFLLIDEQTEGLTPRGQAIIDHTPMGRFGHPEDLLGTALWLLSPASRFVTGIVVPVDGGFSAFGGV